MDDVFFLSMCALVLFIFGWVIFAEYGEFEGLAVIAFALVCVGGVVHSAGKRQKASNAKARSQYPAQPRLNCKAVPIIRRISCGAQLL